MIVVDTNVLMYAVGRSHPLQPAARSFFIDAIGSDVLCTSTEVLQELLHAYLPVGRLATLDAALDLVKRARIVVWPLEREDVVLARQLLDRHPALGARDLCHLASCRRRRVSQIKTFDRALAAAAG